MSNIQHIIVIVASKLTTTKMKIPSCTYVPYVPSVIRPSSHMFRNLGSRKSDPVQRYHEYRRFWDAFKAPGEKSHKNLRWMVRERMMSDPSDKVFFDKMHSLCFILKRVIIVTVT